MEGATTIRRGNVMRLRSTIVSRLELTNAPFSHISYAGVTFDHVAITPGAFDPKLNFRYTKERRKTVSLSPSIISVS